MNTEKNPDLVERIFDELILDRKKERRKTYVKYAIIGALGFSYLAAIIAGMSGSASNKNTESYVAFVKVSGEIMPGKEAGASVLNPLVEKAFEDTAAKGVVLLVNSPGGTPVQASLVYDQIMRLKAAYPDKKVVAVGEDLMTSGAYMIAAAADTIVVNRSTITGSIGVISRGFGFTGLMDKVGVERRVTTAGEAKNLLDPFGPQSEEDRLKQRELLQQIHGHFKDTVLAGRGDRLNRDTPGLFSGTVWTGEQAVKMGLADRLGDLQTVMKEDFGVEATREYSPPRSLMDIVVNGVSAKVASSLAPAVSTHVLAMPE